MEYTKWFVGIISVMFVVVLCIFMFKLNEVNTFQQEVNYQVERHGGLTEAALDELNTHAMNNFGGCIVESDAPNAPCLFPDGTGKTSGFFVKEFKVDSATNEKQYIERTDAAAYGTKINYVITRQIGNGQLVQPMNPVVLGSSASRVRGSAGE